MMQKLIPKAGKIIIMPLSIGRYQSFFFFFFFSLSQMWLDTRNKIVKIPIEDENLTPSETEILTHRAYIGNGENQ